MRSLIPALHRGLKQFGLPLLEKELIEQAARKRTYVIRVGYAAVLFLMATIFFYEILAVASASPLAALGRGKDIVATVVGLQFAGIYFFMPAMTCGVITQEKERDSLQLLFLTRMGPWAILFQKLLGRMVPMFGFLLLSLPLLAIAYTLGGVSPRMLWSGVVMLIVAIIQTGCIALMCSAFFRSTVASFVASYVIMFGLFFGPYFVVMLLMLAAYLLSIPVDELLQRSAGPTGIGGFYLLLFPFFAPPIFFVQSLAPGFLGIVGMALHAGLNLGLSGGMLLLARKFLVSRAFVPSRNVVRSAFQSLGRKKSRAPASATAAVAVAPVPSDDARLPDLQPIVWRETSRRWLGSGRDLLRVLLIAEVPVILFCGLLALAEVQAHKYQAEEIIAMLSAPAHFLMWFLAVLVVAVKSSSLIAGERSHQTLDVLCATPLTGRQILREKMHGVWRIVLVLTVPFMTVFAFKAWRVDVLSQSQAHAWRSHDFDPVSYLAGQALALAILLPLVAWLSLLIGLQLRTQGRAIMGSMAAIMAWSIGPLVFLALPLAILFQRSGTRGDLRDECLELVTLASPATVVFLNEINELKSYKLTTWGTLVINFTVYGALLVCFRWICLNNVDRWLGRLDANDVVRDNAAGEEPQSSAVTPADALGGQPAT